MCIASTYYNAYFIFNSSNLKFNGIRACGTLRQDRKDLPNFAEVPAQKNDPNSKNVAKKKAQAKLKKPRKI